MPKNLTADQLAEVVRLAKVVHDDHWSRWRRRAAEGRIGHDLVADAEERWEAMHAVDPSKAALEEAVAALDPEARHELVALMWIGRGDFCGTFAEAVEQARERDDLRSPDEQVRYVMDKSTVLWRYLSRGLEVIGVELVPSAP